MKSRELDDDYDSTDDEEPDTIGNIPHEWYDEYDHIGYDFDGKKIPKATSITSIFIIIHTFSLYAFLILFSYNLHHYNIYMELCVNIKI